MTIASRWLGALALSGALLVVSLAAVFAATTHALAAAAASPANEPEATVAFWTLSALLAFCGLAGTLALVMHAQPGHLAWLTALAFPVVFAGLLGVSRAAGDDDLGAQRGSLFLMVAVVALIAGAMVPVVSGEVRDALLEPGRRRVLWKVALGASGTVFLVAHAMTVVTLSS